MTWPASAAARCPSRPLRSRTWSRIRVGALAGVAAAQGVRLTHVKPHGALYNMAARQRPLADAIVRAMRAVDPALMLFGLANSELVRAARDAGVAVANEAFADRGYLANGELAPRGAPGGVVSDVDAVLARAGCDGGGPVGRRHRWRAGVADGGHAVRPRRYSWRGRAGPAAAGGAAR